MITGHLKHWFQTIYQTRHTVFHPITRYKEVGSRNLTQLKKLEAVVRKIVCLLRSDIQVTPVTVVISLFSFINYYEFEKSLSKEVKQRHAVFTD